MKRYMIITLMLCAAISLSAQWYLDVGLGLGGGSATLDGKNAISEYEKTGFNPDASVGVELNFLRFGIE